MDRRPAGVVAWTCGECVPLVRGGWNVGYASRLTIVPVWTLCIVVSRSRSRRTPASRGRTSASPAARLLDQLWGRVGRLWSVVVLVAVVTSLLRVKSRSVVVLSCWWLAIVLSFGWVVLSLRGIAITAS